MKISEDVIRNLILNDNYFSIFKVESGDDAYDDLVNEIIIMAIEASKIRFDEIIQVITNLKQCNYAEARIGLRNKENYQDFKKDILNLRTSAKRLLEIIIVTAAITNEQEIRQHKLNWQRFDNFDKDKDVNYYHQHIVYQQFKKVETLDELAGFNSFLHQYLVEMAFKLAEIFIRRINYTIGFLKNEEAFKEICVAATFNVRNFRKAIESLKSKTE